MRGPNHTGIALASKQASAMRGENRPKMKQLKGKSSKDSAFLILQVILGRAIAATTIMRVTKINAIKKQYLRKT
jgi:hypothetical protein